MERIRVCDSCDTQQQGVLEDTGSGDKGSAKGNNEFKGAPRVVMVEGECWMRVIGMATREC